MRETTNEDRRRELDTLLAGLRDHPELPQTAERERVAVLRRVLEGPQAERALQAAQQRG
jgi:hypothetical protein